MSIRPKRLPPGVPAVLAGLLGLLGALIMSVESRAMSVDRPRFVVTGGEVLAASGFASLAGKRVGLVTNHTGLAGGEHLADLLHAAPGATLAAIFAPEHGFRGGIEAGAHVGDDVDARTGVRVFSLYGATRKPTQAMLRGLDILVFDIQDIGARFYTYISTMGLAMQAAAEAGIPFLVLDRPNPLGGHYVSGFVLEPAQRSFVGQYPIPIVHGMTVGELAMMIRGERWLPGLESLDLQVVKAEGWTRSDRWPRTLRDWVATSPNIPTFGSALAYPGIGIVGELAVNEGRGTETPFMRFGASWLDAERLADRLNALRLPGAAFEAESYTPRSIPNVATDPAFLGRRIPAVRVVITDTASYQPLETGMHALALVVAEAREKKVQGLFKNMRMFHLIAGTKRLQRMLAKGASGSAIIAAWQTEIAAFEKLRQPYLLY